jgi:SAM-dependent methyltransferase
MAVKDPTRRFSSRVDHYVRSRPGYPREVLRLLEQECGFSANSVVADIASGTGIFTRLLLEHGNRVFGVEPNDEMRQAGEEFLAAFPQFISVAGTAEATTLPAQSVNIVTAAQAAHWFDTGNARREFVRILRPDGWCVLLWNERQTDSSPFLRAYEELLRSFGTDYQDVRHEHTTAKIDSFYAPSRFQERVFENNQQLDYAGLEARLLSSSYTPQAEDPGYPPMLQELRRIFDLYQSNGQVIVEYKTRVYYGKLS